MAQSPAAAACMKTHQIDAVERNEVRQFTTAALRLGISAADPLSTAGRQTATADFVKSSSTTCGRGQHSRADCRADMVAKS